MALVTRCGVRYSSLLMCYFSASHLSISHHNYRRCFWGRLSSPFAASFDNGNLSTSPRSRCTPLPYHFGCFGRRLPVRIRFRSAWGMSYLWSIDEIAEELWGEIDLDINGGTPEYTWEKVSLGFYCIVWLNIIKKASSLWEEERVLEKSLNRERLNVEALRVDCLCEGKDQ